MSYALQQIVASGLVPGMPRIGARRAPWLPSAMFALANPGIFLDGEDNSVMWQDAAGTTPVTAVGQPVGLILDKRLWGGKTYAQVMAAQPELVTNGDFESGLTGWVVNSGQSISEGQALFDGSNSVGYVRQENVLTSGRSYLVTLDVASVSSGGVRLLAGSGGNGNGMGPTITLAGVHTFVVHPVLSGLLYIFGDVGPFTGAVNSISVREIPGNHATQSTAGSRPTYQLDSNGKPGLQFDGVDDFLVTSSIDFSASDKVLVSAGVRKLSDAARAMLVELGNNSNYAFQLNAPDTPVDYSFGSRGTASAVAATTGFDAPISNVLTGVGDISGDIARLRVDGSQVAESTADQGTGNYGNYPLYIGRRGGSSLPYNGFVHQLVVRGGALPDADQLAKLEAYIAGKNGVTL